MSIQECKAGSAFHSPTKDFPGPQAYNPIKPKPKSCVSIAGKPNRSYSTITPGPKYSFQSTLDDRNKILSQNKKRGSAKFVLPSSKSKLNSTEQFPSSSTIQAGKKSETKSINLPC